MISFASDYTTGAHPKVLERLVETNLEPLSGYGTDPYCAAAIRKIREACECPELSVHFVVGGTQTNQLVISTMLDDCEGVLAATTGHVSVHEAGAIEYSGHKVLTLPESEGKISAKDLKAWLHNFFGDENHEHMVYPGMVYISFPTEYGTLYSKQELTEIHAICREYDLPLFIDGARLGFGLASEACDVRMADLPKLCEVFYIGGTKVGALCGEAICFAPGWEPKHFLTKTKQHGALLAKGRLLGISFDTLFTDDLYMEIGRHAVSLAMKLKEMFLQMGYSLFLDSPTNQQFVILEDSELARISDKVSVSFWEKYDETHTVVRFATGWSTTEKDISDLREILEEKL